MDRATLEWALEDADIPVLLMSLVHLTGDRRWIEPPFTPKRDIRLFPDESGGLSDDVQAEVRRAVLDLLSADEPPVARRIADVELFSSMMSTCVGEDIADEYVPLFLEEMGVVPSWPEWSTAPDPERLGRSKVLIVGAGLSGLATAVILQRVGIPYEIVEKYPEVGGTWWENTYPESGVDTPNHFYSYSFRPNLDWTSYFSKQKEVLDYIIDCVDHFGVRDHIRFETEVVECRWDDRACEWSTLVRPAGTRGDEGATEELRSSALVIGVGQLSQPATPEIDGLAEFEGTVFHTARWRHDVDLTGRRVAMIGAGASAMQVARTVAAQAAHLDIYQRSPHWIAPNQDYHRTVSDRKRWLMHHVPSYAQWYRFVVFWRYGDGLHRSLFVDPSWPHQDRSINARNDRHRDHFTKNYQEKLDGRDDLLAKCLPTYPPYGKRMLVDNEWFSTIRRDDVELVTDKIERFTRTGIVTSDGVERPADVVVMATGFHARKLVWPIRVYGTSGSLEDAWANDNATAYLGITVPGFPNMFLLHGPNTALAHGGSVIFQSECQARYLTRLLMHGIENGIDAFDVRPETHDDYVRRVDEQHDRMVWSHPGMTNWYRNADGRVVSVSPWRLVDYWHMTRTPDPNDYVALHRADLPVG